VRGDHGFVIVTVNREPFESVYVTELTRFVMPVRLNEHEVAFDPIVQPPLVLVNSATNMESQKTADLLMILHPPSHHRIE